MSSAADVLGSIAVLTAVAAIIWSIVTLARTDRPPSYSEKVAAGLVIPVGFFVILGMGAHWNHD